MGSPTQKEEIDLLEAAVTLVRFLMRNLLWVILLPLAGLLTSYFLSNVKRPVYESQMMIRSDGMTEDELTFLISNYQKAGIPGLSHNEQMDHVRDFSFKINTKNNLVFAVLTIVVDDTTVLKKIVSGIAVQIESEELVKAYNKIRHDLNKKMFDDYSKKIEKLEAMIGKKTISEALLAYPDLMDLYAKRAQFEVTRDTNVVKLVSVSNPVIILPNNKRAMLKGLVFGIALSIVFLLTKSFIIYYRKVNKALD